MSQHGAKAGNQPNVDVTITDVQGHVNKNSVTISKSAGNQVIWTNSSNKDMQIAFPSGSPFAGDTFPLAANGGQASSGPAVVPADRNHPYNYTVTPQQGGAGCDPIVIVDN